MSNSNCDSVGHYFLEQTFWFKKPVTILVKRGKLHLCGHAQTHEQWQFLSFSDTLPVAKSTLPVRTMIPRMPPPALHLTSKGGLHKPAWRVLDRKGWYFMDTECLKCSISSLQHWLCFPTLTPAAPPCSPCLRAKGEHFFKYTDITYRSITLWSYYNQSQIEGSLV